MGKKSQLRETNTPEVMAERKKPPMRTVLNDLMKSLAADPTDNCGH